MAAGFSSQNATGALPNPGVAVASSTEVSMETFYIKRNDTSPAIRYALDPATVDLTGATVRFQMRARNGAMVLDAAAAIVTATGTPTVQYGWQPLDTLGSSFKCNTRSLKGIGCCDGPRKQAPQQ
jgi:hypothetical protein